MKAILKPLKGKYYGTEIEIHFEDGEEKEVVKFWNSGKSFKIVVWLDDANRWLNGESIENCFPYLTAETREILMTGNGDEAWERLFGGDDDN